MLAIVFTTGCDKKSDFNEVLPPDENPSIRRTAPTSGSLQGKADTTLALSYTMADNERLASWCVVLTNPASGSRDTLVKDTLAGTLVSRTITYAIPDTFPAGTTRLLFWAYVRDNLGRVDSTGFVYDVTVYAPDTCGGTQQYRMLWYTFAATGRRDTIWNRASIAFANRSSFNLLQRTGTTSDPASDIRETTGLPGTFNAEFRSPNTNPNNVFVVMNTGNFNFSLANWCFIEQAYTTRLATNTTGRLQAGDIVLLDMALPPAASSPLKQHYAAIHIVEVFDDGAASDNDYIVFEYARTENN
jgi:hypothetical protein